MIRVARCAELLAQRHGIDTSKARLAGMLHDLARLYSTERLLDECELREMPIGEFERANPIVLHAPLGARLAQEGFGVRDPEVLSAISKHTVADVQMSPLDCVVYLADGLEPGRPFAERGALWELACADLHAGMRETLKNTFAYLARQGLTAAPQTLAAAKHFGVSEGVLTSLN